MNGKPHVYEAKELSDVRSKLAAHLSKHIPEKPFDGPLQAVVKWMFPTKDKKRHNKFKWTRPDAHNLNKLLFDVMEDLGFWVNDARVASEIIQKFWTLDRPGIWISIVEIIEQ